MRKDPLYFEYCMLLRKHWAGEIIFPLSKQHAYETVLHLGKIAAYVNEIATGGAISKATWTWLNKLPQTEFPNDIPDSLHAVAKEVLYELQKMKTDFEANAETLLVDGFTTTKSGRKRIREAYSSICKSLRKIREDDYKWKSS